MAMAVVSHYFVVFVLNVVVIFAFDPMPMQDICVADSKTPSFNEVKPCKRPESVKADDFFHSGLNIPGKTNNNPFKFALTPVGPDKVPGLNTMGMSMARLDLEPGGLIPLHIHQRATELHLVLEGCLGVGFVTSSTTNYTLYEKELREGDMFVVPMGLVHYQKNCGKGKTSSYTVFNSQNPGINSVSHAVFGTNPPMNSSYLAAAYQLNEKIIRGLQNKKWI